MRGGGWEAAFPAAAQLWTRLPDVGAGKSVGTQGLPPHPWGLGTGREPRGGD